MKAKPQRGPNSMRDVIRISWEDTCGKTLFSMQKSVGSAAEACQPALAQKHPFFDDISIKEYFQNTLWLKWLDGYA